jgi:hypothetical protein
MTNIVKRRGWIIWLMMVGFLLCSAAGASATTYYIAASGSDSDSGTSKSTPWLHAPGMSTCTANCASVTPQPGDRVVFRGGDTWHFGNSAANPYTSTLNISRSGTAASPIYYGVDKTWYSGASWARPIFDGDNPPSATAVSSCTYDESTKTFVYMGQAIHIILDDIEFTGMCWHGNQSNANEHICCAAYVNWSCGLSGAEACGSTLSNLYMHGWTHVAFNCSLSGGEPTGNCDGAVGVTGTSQNNTGGGDKIIGLVCDGADADGVSFACILWDCYDVEGSVLRYAEQGAVCNNMHIWHDDLIEYIRESADGVSHSNGFEFNNEWSATAGAPNYVYNVVERNVTAAVTGWVCPHYGDVYWNIVSYKNSAQPWDVDTGCGNPNVYFYNSVFADEGTVGNTTSSSWNGNFQNVLFVNSGISGRTNGTVANTITMTDAEATTAGFTPDSVYAYQPQSDTCNGQTSPTCPIKNGMNLTDVWPSGFVTNDASYACTYDTTFHSVSCPARASLTRPSTGNWDVGAYQFGTTTSSSPQPPTGLTVVVH